MTGTLIGMGLASCTNENTSLGSKNNGTISLDVDKLMPKPKNAPANANMETRAVETVDFPVVIYSLTDNQEFIAYDKASQVPNKLVMPVGKYYATAHTPGTLEKVMENPYYTGREEFEIMKNINTEATVTCSMANSLIAVAFDDEFTQAFSTWTVSIDDGGSSAIVYTHTQGQNPAPKYLLFDEGIEILKVNFVGNTTNGNRIVTSNNLTKKDASEQYESDNAFFAGGDAIKINFKPVESSEGDITGINVSANISFEETEEIFEMEVEDADNTGGDNPDNPDEPGGDTNAITLNLPSNMKVDITTDPAAGDAYMAAENGFKSIIVKMASTNADMVSSLKDLNAGYGTDFINGTEVVGSQNLVDMFSALGQTLNVPAEGDKEYTFPIGNFFTMLAILPGEHTIELSVTDLKGNVKNGQVVLTVE